MAGMPLTVRCYLSWSHTSEYFGVHLDLRNNPLESYERVLQDATNRLSHLLRQPGSPSVKIDYIRFKILPIVLYTALCSNWTLLQYRALDQPFSQTYRKILCLPAKAPTAMLYLPSSMAGIGLPRVSDQAQIMKWESFLRCSAVHGDPAASVDAFFDRIPQPVHPIDTPLRTLVCPPPNEWPTQALTARSLVEWAAESDLILANRVFQTTDEMRYERQNDNTIHELAQELDLCMDPMRHIEVQDLTTLSLFATDGSYKAETTGAQDVITSEAMLRDQGKGAGGIVFIPTDRHAPVHGVRITSNNPEPGMNAFTWELLTQLVAVHMVKHQRQDLPGYSDCTSAIARTNKALRSYNNPLAHTRGGLWASGAHVFSNHKHPRSFQHIKAHPERCPERTKHPTIQDKAIFMADAIAGQSSQRLGRIDLPTVPHSLVLENIMDEIVPLRQWHFRTANLHQTPVLSDILGHQHSTMLTNMTTYRDS